MTDKPVIGFIGLGFMGHGMARNLRLKGYELWVKGRANRVPVESLLAMGAREAASPKEMAQTCDIIHICLSNSPQIEATMRGPDGILAGARPGLIVIDTSTANPGSTEALAAELAAKGGHFVDAPLGGTPVQAEAGQLSAMVGCDAAIFDRVAPVIGSWAARRHPHWSGRQWPQDEALDELHRLVLCRPLFGSRGPGGQGRDLPPDHS